jgi:hypothetical protein
MALIYSLVGTLKKNQCESKFKCPGVFVMGAMCVTWYSEL